MGRDWSKLVLYTSCYLRKLYPCSHECILTREYYIWYSFMLGGILVVVFVCGGGGGRGVREGVG